jgi:hypothetical protein
VREISDLGKSLYERIWALAGHFVVVGRSLSQAVDATRDNSLGFQGESQGSGGDGREVF